MKRQIFSLASASLLAATLTACGGSSSDTVVAPSKPTVSGQVVDGVVSGLGYQCGSTLAMTDDEGRFYCTRGQTVRFFLGDVTLGSVSASADMVVTPAMLAGEGAVNLAKLLLALDEDGDPDNGLQMPADVDTWFDGQVIDFSNDTAFADEGQVDNLVEQIVGDAENDLPDTGTVLAHLRQSARDIVSGLYLGGYNDSESGESSELALIINRSGDIIGEIWTADDAGSQRVTDGYEAEGGFPDLSMRGFGGGIEVSPKRDLEMPMVAVEEAIGGYGNVENGVLEAVTNTETWQADRSLAGALPMNTELLGEVIGGPYNLNLMADIVAEEGAEGELMPRFALPAAPPVTTGNLEVFSNGDLVMTIGAWHCEVMDPQDPDYSDCDSFDNSYGGEVNNGVVTATDADTLRIHFVAIDNGILVEGYLQRPLPLDAAPTPLITLVTEPAGPGYATLVGTWTSLTTGANGIISGGSVID